jgi:uncharacterized membrane-anchored protein YjiN (DUF445 family)
MRLPPRAASTLDGEADVSISQPKDQRLRAMKHCATALLVAAVLVYLAAIAFEPEFPWLSWVAAAAEAGIVGALADWFAVVALFHHPLNLRIIPHTNIVSRNKGRIAEQLALFIQREFLAPELIVSRLRALNPAGRLTGWLMREENVNRIADYATDLLGYSLKAVEDTRVKNFLQEAAGEGLREFELAPILAAVLEALTQDRRHHLLLDAALATADDVLSRVETRTYIADELVRHFWILRLSKLMTLKLSDRTAEKIVGVVSEVLSGVRNDPEHELRRRFDEATAGFIDRLRNDLALREQIEGVKREALEGGALRRYLEALWKELHAWAIADIGRDDSAIHAHICSGVRFIAARLHHDHDVQAWINEQILKEAPGLVLRYRADIGRFVEDQVNSWTSDKLVDEIERAIGPDLQFIRINGTLVGACVGLALHALTRLFAP